MLSIKSPADVANQLADRFRQLRLTQAWSREELASRSGVTAASIKRFENTGAIALDRLLALAMTLHVIDEFDQLLSHRPPPSLAALKKSLNARQRGRKQTT